jgi:lipopolysaccharide/colanic/teichoic acid biosynthesis glycosyltransferase
VSVRRGNGFLKRAFDATAAAAGLVVLSPILAAAAGTVLATMGRPILWKHVRPGRDEKPFTMYKFRTMRPAAPGEVWFRTDADRLTPIGRFLRKTSIDELPELWNVVKGDMSLVGPRPLLLEYLPRYTSEQRRRHEVRPGITGWAQVNGRQSIKFSKRLEHDVWYVDHSSLWLDAKILAMTVKQSIFGSGVYSGQNVDDVDDLGLAPRTLETNGGGGALPSR